MSTETNLRPPAFVPSVNQQRVFDFVSNGSGSAIIEAVAGSGKTTTIVKALELIDPSRTVSFLAFNKKIATELETRVPKHVKASTFHAAGFSAWRKFAGRVQVDANKCRNIARMIFSEEVMQAFGGVMFRLVSLAKSSGVGAILPDDVPTWLALADHHDIEHGESEADLIEAIELARELLAASIADAMDRRGSMIDFDDMLFMPLLKNVPFFQVDWLFVDEAQDTNAVQLALLRRMLKPGGRLVAVGDTRQAIYGFRGADSSAMANIATAFNCAHLPLTISYRCAQSVVRLAQSIVPHIEAAPSAPEGEVIEAARLDGIGGWEACRDSVVESYTFTNSDVIICRNTAPLVSQAYAFIGRGIGCKVLGREIGAALATLVNKMKAKGVDQLLVKLEKFAEREMARFMSRGQEQKAEAVRDQVDCVLAIVANQHENNRTIPAVLAAIDSMFSDSTAGILTLCTAHKSKGLEWNRVFVLRPDLMPSKYARQEWQQEQERNLQYVAWTRAKHSLVFLVKA